MDIIPINILCRSKNKKKYEILENLQKKSYWQRTLIRMWNAEHILKCVECGRAEWEYGIYSKICGARIKCGKRNAEFLPVMWSIIFVLYGLHILLHNINKRAPNPESVQMAITIIICITGLSHRPELDFGIVQHRIIYTYGLFLYLGWCDRIDSLDIW